MTAEDRVNVRVIYHGRVQGVGFRMTAANIAQRFDVGGYVKNLRNGTVELFAAGNPGEVDRFLQAVSEAMGGNIEHADREQLVSKQELTDFRVAY